MAADRKLHCWTGAGDDAVIGSAEWVEARLRYPDGATCFLERGHAGPHEYTPDTDVLISFPEREGAADAAE